jgi:hypothetical protein
MTPIVLIEETGTYSKLHRYKARLSVSPFCNISGGCVVEDLGKACPVPQIGSINKVHDGWAVTRSWHGFGHAAEAAFVSSLDWGRFGGPFYYSAAF